MKIAILHVRK